MSRRRVHPVVQIIVCVPVFVVLALLGAVAMLVEWVREKVTGRQ